MVSFNQIIQGLLRYIDAEILPKISGIQKWAAGVAANLAVNNSMQIFHNLKNNQYVKMLNIIDDHDQVNLDILYTEFKKQAQKGPIVMDFPMIGSFTFNEMDVNKLYSYIQGGN